MTKPIESPEAEGLRLFEEGRGLSQLWGDVSKQNFPAYSRVLAGFQGGYESPASVARREAALRDDAGATGQFTGQGMGAELSGIAKAIAAGELFVTDEVLERVRHLLCLLPHKIINLQVDGDGTRVVALCQQYEGSPQMSVIWDSDEAADGEGRRGYQILPMTAPDVQRGGYFRQPKRPSLISRLRAAWAAFKGEDE